MVYQAHLLGKCHIQASGPPWVPWHPLQLQQRCTRLRIITCRQPDCKPGIPPTCKHLSNLKALSSISACPQNDVVLSKHVATFFSMISTSVHCEKPVPSVTLELNPLSHPPLLYPNTRYFRKPFEMTISLGVCSLPFGTAGLSK